MRLLLRFTKIVSVLSLLLLVPVFAFGQAISGDIVGTVKDNSGAVVADAPVEATNLGTGFKTSVKTSTGGEFHFVNLPSGHYSVKASGGGLAGTIADVEVQLNRTVTANVIVTPTSSTTTVEVNEAAASVNTTTAQIENTFTASQVANSPLASTGSGVINLSLLNAGVATQGGIGLGSGPAISGQRPRNNNFTVEGVDNNNKGVTGPLLQIPNDAVENFTVLQNQFSPEFGHSSGGQFNQTIKGGTNTFHGGLYEYFQNRTLNAQDSIVAESQRSNGLPTTNTRLDNNRFGGQIGGPIIKNKLFFYTLFEYNPQGLSSSSTGCTPTAAGYSTLASMAGVSQVNLSEFQKGAGTASAQALASDANCAGADAANPGTTTVAGTLIPIGPVGYSHSYYINNLTTVNSVDYNISEKDQLRARLSYQKQDNQDISAQVPSFWTNQPNRFWLFTLGEYHSFGPHLSNEFRLGYNRFAQDIPDGGFTFPGLGAYPNLQVGFGETAGVQLGPDPNSPQFAIQNTYSGVDNVTWLHGKHNLKFGVEYREYITPQGFTQRARGDYEWTTFDGYFTDQIPDYIAERSIGSVTYYGNQNAIYSFVNDDYKVLPNLTVNLGLRYEFTQVPLSERVWQPQNAISNVPGLISFGEPTSQKKNFLPRVGFAYSPGNSGNTSIRGGFGMAVDVLYDNLGLLSAPPQVQQTCDVGAATATCFWTDPTIAGQPGFIAGGALPSSNAIPALNQADARASTAGWIPDQKLPYSETWNLGVQHQFASKYVAEVRYVGTRGIHLPVQQRVNRQSKTTDSLFLPTFLTMPDAATIAGLTTTLAQINGNSSFVPAYEAAGFTGANVTAFQPWGTSHYNGLQTSLSRSFTSGLQFQLSYTWSHAIDNSTADVFSTYLTPRRPQDFQCFQCDNSTSALDRRHRFTAFLTYDVPFFKNSSWFAKNLLGNWEVSPVYTFQSPEYVTVQSGTDTNLNGDTAGDRAIYNPAGVAGTGSGVTAIKNTAGDTVGYVADSANAQYIVAGKGAKATASRNTLALPHINNMDFSLMKRISITERQSLQFQFQATNVFNHAQYVPGNISDVAPLTNISYTGSNVLQTLIPSSASFNKPQSVWSNHPRNVVLVLKYNF
jgi:hypothetical protein